MELLRVYFDAIFRRATPSFPPPPSVPRDTAKKCANGKSGRKEGREKKSALSSLLPFIASFFLFFIISLLLFSPLSTPSRTATSAAAKAKAAAARPLKNSPHIMVGRGRKNRRPRKREELRKERLLQREGREGKEKENFFARLCETRVGETRRKRIVCPCKPRAKRARKRNGLFLEGLCAT